MTSRRRGRLARLLAGVVGVALAAAAAPSAGSPSSTVDEAADEDVVPDGHPRPATPRAGGDQAGRGLLAAAFAGPRRAVVGTVAVIVLDPDGPFVSELDVSATPTGEMVVGRRSTFAVGRDGGDAFLARDGTLLRLGSVGATEESAAASLEVLFDNYDVHFAGRASLDTGVADAVDLFDGDAQRRERLFVDRQTGVVVRRETYGHDGQIRRLVAFTHVDVIVPQFGSQDVPVDIVADTGPVADLAPQSLQTLGRTGWHVPESLPGGYVLAGGYALDDEGDASSLHLVYTDGLYSTSVYQQPGKVAASAREGAVAVRHGERHLWRWPGSQPERLLWSAGGMTFTVVGDASLDQLLEAAEALPAGEPESVGDRVGRGVRRVLSWLNPFA